MDMTKKKQIQKRYNTGNLHKLPPGWQVEVRCSGRESTSCSFFSTQDVDPLIKPFPQQCLRYTTSYSMLWQSCNREQDIHTFSLLKRVVIKVWNGYILEEKQSLLCWTSAKSSLKCLIRILISTQWQWQWSSCQSIWSPIFHPSLTLLKTSMFSYQRIHPLVQLSFKWKIISFSILTSHRIRRTEQVSWYVPVFCPVWHWIRDIKE